MKILITGSNGQLGKELMEKFQTEPQFDVLGYDRETLDITDYLSIVSVMNQFMPNVVINSAAYTNVDGCESDYKGANAVNHIGAMYVARAANLVGAKIIHLSTDFVFDGEKGNPYFEYDETNPISVYGKTKLAGEWAVRKECQRHFIIRTSWLYGKYGNNFVKTMIKLGKQNDSISVVTDQVGSPTCVTSLVNMIIELLGSDLYGTYHFSNSGSCSWNEFAREILLLMDINTPILDVTSKTFIRPAKRPAYSVMDTSLIENTFEVTTESWRDSLKKYIDSNCDRLQEP